MGFCCLGRDYIREGYTQIDNVFLSKYLADADAIDVKVYLYGLLLAKEDRDNTLERIAYALRLTEERIISAYGYWQDLGLVTIRQTPDFQVVYNSVKMPVSKTVLYNAREFSEFVDELRRVFPEKILSEQDVMKYVETMQSYKMEQNAMLLIARYCRDKRGTTNTASVVGLASSWAKQGLTTMNAVNERLDELEKDSEDTRLLFAELGLKSKPAVEDQELFAEWTKQGFQLNAILTAARACKRKGGMSKLSRLMDELYSAGALTSIEVDAYLKEKEDIRKFTGEVIRTIGSYYASLEMPIETYVNPWLKLGYEKNAILAIAKFCFLRNVKTLDGMQTVIDKFYKLGIVTLDGINAYVSRQAKIDESIKEVLEKANAEPFISNRDRDFYRAFIEDWGFEHDVVLAVAENASGKPFPMSYINKILLIFKQNGINTVSGAKAFFESAPVEKKKKPTLIKQEYTAEEISSVFRDIDDLDIDSLRI
ncbi:MAG: DnaD domain protein [Clostridia bacterium]|nr:DnaD domain protein [Clostridia bacterium]